ncbi:MAG: hypothetical protein ACR2P0_20885 [Acidimicrobiales bacterium]
MFTDLPLGNPYGPPDSPKDQIATLELALEVAGTATRPRSTVHAPVVWPGNASWRDTFMPTDDAEALARAGEERRAAQALAKNPAGQRTREERPHR